MAISKGDIGIGKVYVGPSEVGTAYVGDKLVYQSGIPYDPVFGNNDWATIRAIARSGKIPDEWTIGSVKNFRPVGYGVDYQIRLCDKKPGRYALADGTGRSNMVLELVSISFNTPLNGGINSSASNVGGYAAMTGRTTLNNAISGYPADFVAAISEVIVLTGKGGSSTETVGAVCKIFPPAECEIVSPTYSIGAAESPSGRFQWYASHTAASSRIKYKNGTANGWWTRSPKAANSTNFVWVTKAGAVQDNWQASDGAPFPAFFAI